ncbi:MAG: DUF3347 domain-containing protein, partial [Bacteroidetes bacterium]|nr:DUF3347 domain-containing protein [Bacteroidota bacterium]
AEKMAAQLKKIDMSLLQGEAHIYWMKQMRILEAHTEKILASQDIKEQRKQFLFLSTGLINAVSAFGIAGEQTLYVQHCPMAMDDKGADWLSYTKNILNPYFGEEMLTCGIVKEELNSAKNEKPVN